MIHYIYDGSFEGLLTAIYEAYYRKENPDDIIPINAQEDNFLVQRYQIVTNKEKASKVYKSIEKNISKESLRRVFYVYLSELPLHGIYILDYLRLGFKMGKDIDYNLANDSVLRIDNIFKKVAGERHRLHGLIRFKMVEGDMLFSTIEPEYNVAGLVAPHFANRLSNENWAIYDKKRNIGVFYNKKEWVIRDLEIEDNIMLKEDEEEYQQLWKAYYKHISIESRKNLRLKKNHMPMKYWKHLIEI